VSIGVVAAAMSASTAAAADIYVPQGGDLQAAINRAVPGDRILLQPGATFVGNFKLPDKGSSSVYITIRSAAADLLLPPDGVRIRPSDAVNLPVIKSPNTVSALVASPGAHHWRLQFLEFRANDRGYGDIISLGSGSSSQNLLSQVPHDLILDRVYVHGDPVIGQKRGIAVHSGATWILNSHISDIKAVGIDTQAIMGYNGPGPWTFINNYLEATGENFLLGGASPKIQGLVPADIEFSRNYVFKPIEWRNPILAKPAGVSATPSAGGSLPAGTFSYRVLAGMKTAQDQWAYSPRSTEVLAATAAGGSVTVTWAPVPNATRYRVYRGPSAGAQDRYFEVTGTTFVDTGTLAGVAGSGSSMNGTLWQVKNLLELKLGSRVVIDGNVMENTWLAAQTGYAVLFTPRNQDDTSPWVYLRDVTFSRNIVRHAGSGFQIEGYDSEHASQQTQRIVIRGNLFDDISAKRWGGDGRFVQIGNAPRDITIDHNTIVHDGQFIYVYGGNIGAGQPVDGLVATNNLAKHNTYGIMGAGRTYGNDTINAYFPDAVILRNTFAGGSASKYPAGNEFPTVAYWQSQFTDFAQQDYRLAAASPYIGSGTDGGDLGAPIAELAEIDAVVVSGGVGTAPALPPVQISTQSLPDGQAGVAYSQMLSATGGSGDYTWSVASGELPAGVALGASGTVAGTPSQAGTATFTVRVADAADSSMAAAATLTLRVAAAPLSIVTSALPSADAGTAYTAMLAASGGTTPYVWRVAGGALPPGLSLSGSGSLAGTPAAGGAYDVTISVDDGAGVSAERAFTLTVAAAKVPPTVALTMPLDGQRFTGSTLMVAASPADSDGTVVRVDFYANAVLVASSSSAPWLATWANIVPGAYTVSAVATDDSGLTGTSAPASVTIEAPAPPPPPPSPPPPPPPPPPSGGDDRIVVHAADGVRVAGRWSRLIDATAATGYKLSSVDLGREAATALASPADYFETTFTAAANTAYHVWVRMRARNNSVTNDAIWVQFSDSVNGAGQPLYRIGSTSALLVNLEACNGCGVSGWGWMDSAPGVPQTDVAFAGGGTHVVRVQMRQDGAEVDQIVLVPVSSGGGAPGANRDDTTIVPANPGTPSDIVVYAADVPAAALRGGWSLAASSESPGGKRLVNADRGKTTKTAMPSPSDSIEIAVPAVGKTPYRVWLRMRALNDSASNDSVWVQYSDAVLSNNIPVYPLGSSSAQGLTLAGCLGCKPDGWGWTNGDLQPVPTVMFRSNGLHTIRIQPRDDGAFIDQIVLSPANYLDTPPGSMTNDTTAVPKP
jgi:hypothetical protein